MIITLKLSFVADTCRHETFQHIPGHTPETQLKPMLLHLHVNKHGRKRTHRDCDMRVMLLSQADYAVENLTLCLKHTVHILQGIVYAAVAPVDIGVYHVCSAKEMKDVGMSLRLVAKHI